MQPVKPQENVERIVRKTLEVLALSQTALALLLEAHFTYQRQIEQSCRLLDRSNRLLRTIQFQESGLSFSEPDA